MARNQFRVRLSKARRIALELPEAQRVALIGAFPMSDGSGLYIRSGVRMDVRRRLFDLGLLSKRPANPLNKLGREVRDLLIEAQP